MTIVKKTAPIINRTSAVSLSSRVGWQLVAATMWAIWISCWIPLVTLTIWEIGLFHVNAALLATNGLSQLRALILPYLSVLACQGGILLGWMLKDYARFNALARRSQMPAADLTELAHFSQIAEARLAQWQSARNVVAEHDEHGRLRHVKIRQMHRRLRRNGDDLPLGAVIPAIASVSERALTELLQPLAEIAHHESAQRRTLHQHSGVAEYNLDRVECK